MRRPCYPCQDPKGLPLPAARALTRWTRKPQHLAAGHCLDASLYLLDKGRLPGGCAVAGIAVLPDGVMLHHWVEWNGRIIDPTRQQFGAGAVVYRRALPPVQGDGWLHWRAAHDIIRNRPHNTPGLGAEVLAATCEPEPCYSEETP